MKSIRIIDKNFNLVGRLIALNHSPTLDDSEALVDLI